MYFLQKIAGGGLFLAESDSDYGWIVYLVIFFIVFLGPILKKAAEALGLTKKEPPPGRRQGGPSRPAQQGPVKQILDEVEKYFGQTRGQGTDRADVAKSDKTKYKQYSEYDVKYKERKRELEELRRRRDERLQRKKVEVVEPSVGPVIEQEPEGLVVIEEPKKDFQVGKKFEFKSGLSSEMEKDRRRAGKTESVEKTRLFNMFDDLPEISRIIVLSEVISRPRSLREYSEVF